MLSRLEAHSHVLASGRIEAYRSYLEQPIESFETPERHALILREVFELVWILDGFAQKHPNGSHEALQSLVSGALFSHEDKNPLARNFQFELRIAAYFCRAGFGVDLTKDTDLIVSHNGKKYFVECKRIASENQFERRVKEAGNQVLKRLNQGNYKDGEAFGVIAIDVASLIDDKEKLWSGWTSFHQRKRVQKKLKELDKKISSFVTPEAKKKCVLMWKQAVVCGYLRFPRLITTRFSSVFELNEQLGLRNESLHLYGRLSSVIEQVNSQPAKESNSFPKHVTIPAGLECSFRSDLIEYFEVNLSLPDMHPDEVILKASLHGVDHVFRFYELKFAVSQFAEKDWAECRKGSDGIMYSFVGSLWYWRERL